MKKNNNSIYAENHYKLMDRILIKKRLDMIKIINEYLEDQSTLDVLDIGSTNDNDHHSSNYIIKNLNKFNSYKSISDQKIQTTFFDKCLNKSIIEDFSKEELEEYSSDLVISNATIEHVGSYDNQFKMLNNIIKLSKKYFIIITPNRFHPIELHTKLPFIHWLPKKIHRILLKLIGFESLSKEENLNLMSKTDLLSMIKNFGDIEFDIK